MAYIQVRAERRARADPRGMRGSLRDGGGAAAGPPRAPCPVWVRNFGLTSGEEFPAATAAPGEGPGGAGAAAGPAAVAGETPGQERIPAGLASSPRASLCWGSGMAPGTCEPVPIPHKDLSEGGGC